MRQSGGGHQRWPGQRARGSEGASFQLQPAEAGASARQAAVGDSACCVSESRLDREAEEDGAAGPGDDVGAFISQAKGVWIPTTRRRSDSAPAAWPAAPAGAHSGDTAHAAALPPTGAPTRRGPALLAGAAYLWAR